MVSALNQGFYIINESKLGPGDRAVFCVLGMPRGGTTMAARLLEAAGVSMGGDLPVTAEDPQFAALLKEPKPDQEEFTRLLAERKARYQRWGFKAPYRNHWQLLGSIENVRFLVVFRDVLAVANRNRISADADLVANMRDNLRLQAAILDFIAAGEHPALLFSYEKAILTPDPVCSAILEFAGVERSDSAISKLTHVIQPNEPAYVASQAPEAVKTTLHVDILDSGRIAGWARRSNGNSMNLAVEIDGKRLLDFEAKLPRRDLASMFGRDGRYGFDVKLPIGRRLNAGNEIVIKNSVDGRVLFQRVFGA